MQMLSSRVFSGRRSISAPRTCRLTTCCVRAYDFIRDWCCSLFCFSWIRWMLKLQLRSVLLRGYYITLVSVLLVRRIFENSSSARLVESLAGGWLLIVDFGVGTSKRPSASSFDEAFSLSSARASTFRGRNSLLET